MKLFSLIALCLVIAAASAGKGKGKGSNSESEAPSLLDELESGVAQCFAEGARRKRFVPNFNPAVVAPPAQATNIGCLGDGGAGCEDEVPPPPTPIEALSTALSGCFECANRKKRDASDSKKSGSKKSGSSGSSGERNLSIKDQIIEELGEAFGLDEVKGSCGVNAEFLALLEGAPAKLAAALKCGNANAVDDANAALGVYFAAMKESQECVDACSCVTGISAAASLCDAALAGNLPKSILDEKKCHGKCARMANNAAQGLAEDLCPEGGQPACPIELGIPEASVAAAAAEEA